jgi:putative transposase
MKASQFSDAQNAFILKQGNDGVPVADICRKAGISQATYFNWKKKYEGMQPPEMRRLIPIRVDQNPLAHCRSPMDMMRHGWLWSLFHA